MSFRYKFLITLPVVVLAFLLSKYGNLYGFITDYGINLLQVICIVSLVSIPLVQILRVKPVKTWMLLLILVLLVFPVLYLTGIIANAHEKLLIVYPVVVITAAIVFRRELIGNGSN